MSESCEMLIMAAEIVETAFWSFVLTVMGKSCNIVALMATLVKKKRLAKLFFVQVLGFWKFSHVAKKKLWSSLQEKKNCKFSLMMLKAFLGSKHVSWNVDKSLICVINVKTLCNLFLRQVCVSLNSLLSLSRDGRLLLFSFLRSKKRKKRKVRKKSK